MSKERYTIKTEGSRTIVHWEGKAGKIAVRPAMTGRFVVPAPKPSQRDPGKGAKKK